MSETIQGLKESQLWNLSAWTDQRSPALAIVARGDQIRSTAPNEWTVCSQGRPGKFQHIRQTGSRWTCNCSFFAATSKVCIHVLSVRYRQGFQEPVTAPSIAPACDRCRSTEVIAYGKRHNKRRRSDFSL